MDPIQLLRIYINEPTDETYSDIQLQAFLDLNGGNVRNTAHFIWNLKAASVFSEMSSMTITKMQIGPQSYEYQSLKDKYEMALAMANLYNISSDPLNNTVRVSKISRPKLFSEYGE